MSLYVCMQCSRDMRCVFNGIGIDYGNGHVYPGDVWWCPSCTIEITATTGQPTYDPEYNKYSKYLWAYRKPPKISKSPEDKQYIEGHYT